MWCYGRWIFSLLLLLLSLASEPALAQITGTFFPTVIGEIQEGFTPYPLLPQADVPYYQAQALNFENEINYAQRPYFRTISAYANQSLLGPAAQMDSFSPQSTQFGFFPTRQSEVRLTYVPTIFGKAGLRGPRTMGQEFRVFGKYQPTDKLRLDAQLGLYQYVRTKEISGGFTVLGAAQASYLLHDRLRLTAGYRRDIVGSSLLATTGLNLPESGLLVGRVHQNFFYTIAHLRFTNKTSCSFTVGGGTETGTRLLTNPWFTGGAYLSRSIYSGPRNNFISNIFGSYQASVVAFKYDQSLIGNAIFQVDPPQNLNARLAILRSSRLGNTALTPELERRVGGYFSPSQQYIQGWGVGVNGHVIKNLYWRGACAMGIGTSAPNVGVTKDDLGVWSFGGSASSALTYRVGRSVHEQGWYFLQGSTTYRRQVLYSQSKFFF